MFIINFPHAHSQYVCTIHERFKRIHHKNKEEPISQRMHYHLLLNINGGRELAKLKTVFFDQMCFSSLIFHMHIFNMSVTLLQSSQNDTANALGGVDFTKYALSAIT